jgi:hypothetical protein
MTATIDDDGLIAVRDERRDLVTPIPAIAETTVQQHDRGPRSVA